MNDINGEPGDRNGLNAARGILISIGLMLPVCVVVIAVITWVLR